MIQYSLRCGLISARERITCAWEPDIPTAAPNCSSVQRSGRAPSGVADGRVHALAINNALVSGPCVSGAPGRVASRKPSIPWRA
jgi:hypothetical protein